MSKKGMRFLESSSTPEEDSYRYRIDWDDRISSNVNEYVRNGNQFTHYGAGSRSVGGFDNAWEAFNDLRNNPNFSGVKLIQIDSDGNEITRDT